MFEISSDFPIPERGSGRNGLTQTLRKMRKGDSTEVPLAKKASIYGAARAAGAKVRTCATGYGSVRVWRIDGPERQRTDTNIFGEPADKDILS